MKNKNYINKINRKYLKSIKQKIKLWNKKIVKFKN